MLMHFLNGLKYQSAEMERDMSSVTSVVRQCIRLRKLENVVNSTGTTVTFLPDKQIFEETVYDYDILKQRLREMAFLTKGLKIILTDKREGMEREKTFHYEGGIREFVSYLNRSKEALYPEIIYCEGEKDGVAVEVAMQHNDSYTENTYGFVNNINTPEGGTHITGFRNAITNTFNDYARKISFSRTASQTFPVMISEKA